MKKTFFIIFLIFLCTGCQNDYERKINVLNWSSYIPSYVIDNFEQETGIKVNYGTYSSNEELLAKVSSVKEGTYDVVFPSDYMVEIMKNKNMLERINHDRLSNYSNLNKKYLNLSYDEFNEFSIPFVAASTLIAVNREKITDNITSYNDLLNPKYQNEIVLIDDERIVIGMALLAKGYSMNSMEEYQLQEAYEWLKQLNENVKAYDSDSPKNFLITKEASIALIWNAEAALAKQENPMIETIFPQEGTALSIDNMVILKNSPHQDEAYIFIDYILNEYVMKEIISSYPYKNINQETDKILDSNYLDNDASNILDSQLENGYFVNNIGYSVKQYDKIWAKIK